MKFWKHSFPVKIIMGWNFLILTMILRRNDESIGFLAKLVSDWKEILLAWSWEEMVKVKISRRNKYRVENIITSHDFEEI